MTDSDAMHSTTLSVLDDYYAHLLSADHAELWGAVTVRPHGERLGSYEGYYVAWRGDGVHVSMPPSGGQGTRDTLFKEPLAILQNPGFWRDFAANRGLQVIGPSTHAYLDEDPGPVDGVTRLREDDLASLRRAVDAADWAESGWNDRPPHLFGVYENDMLVAAANLNLFHHQPRDIGVVVAPSARGRRLSVKVGQHAASFAIRGYGFARWGARDTNAASRAVSSRLGFEPWCSQLAVR